MANTWYSPIARKGRPDLESGRQTGLIVPRLALNGSEKQWHKYCRVEGRGKEKEMSVKGRSVKEKSKLIRRAGKMRYAMRQRNVDGKKRQ
jgi:hypothetical protein